MTTTKPYQIKLEVTPDSESKNPQLNDIGGALATICVFDSSRESALEKTTRYVQSLGWVVAKISDICQLQPGLLPHWDIQKALLYRDAELLGICGRFHAWPKKPRPGEYSVHSLKKPPGKK